MNIFIDSQQTVEYFLKSDTEHSIKFLLRPLSSYLYFLSKDAIAGAEHSPDFVASLNLVRFGIRDISGVEAEFEDLKTPYGTERVLSEKFVLSLRPDVLVELSSEVIKLNTLSQEQREGF